MIDTFLIKLTQFKKLGQGVNFFFYWETSNTLSKLKVVDVFCANTASIIGKHKLLKFEQTNLNLTQKVHKPSSVFINA